ncbi:MAG: ABC transporter permease subunit [Candidatus Thiodiazotropha sp.]
MFVYDWNFGRITPYVDAFTSGIYFTISLSVTTIIFSTVVGVIWGISLSRSQSVRVLTTPVLDVLRSLPPLVLVLFGYYFYTKEVVGVSFPAFWSFVLSVGFNVAAFIADLTRASIINTPRDFKELGESMGLSERQILRHIVAPIASRELVPPLSYLYIETIKLTSLASVINVNETVYVAQSVIADVSRSLEVWVIVGAIYLVLIIPLTFIVRALEIRMKRGAGLIE